MFCKEFAGYNYNGCSIDPLTNYIHNTLFQELPNKDKYFGNGYDERIYIDLRDSYGYTSEMEKPIRNFSKLIIKVELRNLLVRK